MFLIVNGFRLENTVAKYGWLLNADLYFKYAINRLRLVLKLAGIMISL